ncbi:PREDICTED: uncharacterized protein LOC105457069 [Wasmannia auropunctata]|uniref:uncharacterized protein LOC105457069 n=1 Tax=Wasmannia auropunctata TaxID=64793 RepID=UPI0005EDCEFD|nr:PREDICTED: uncharacterized protein LOC105457069 [Wasmannia auropunctata]
MSKSQSDPEVKSKKIHSAENTSSVTVNNAAVNSGQQVLLATALVNVINGKAGVKSVRALLDNGSQSCFITKDCCTELGLNQRDTDIPVCGIGKHSIQTRSIARIILQSRTTGYKKALDCLVVDTITQNLPINGISKRELQIPNGIVLADPQFHQSSKIDLLIGAEIFFDLLCIGRIKLAANQPSWQKTLLGWIVSGGLVAKQKPNVTVCSLSVNEQLSDSLTRFWQLESCNRINVRTPEERACENHFNETYKRDQEGRFIITLPIKTDILNKLGDSKEIATQRLYSLERKLKREPQRRIEYNKFMREYIQLGHMRKLQEPIDEKLTCFYMPHHCVIKDNSTTTRLRVVFDASSKTASGISLNDALMVGPVLQQESVSILLRFRVHEYVLTGDLEKMYRQIRVNKEQTQLQRILWREEPSDNIKTYELLTLTYGTASASFVATKVIQKLAERSAHQFPKGSVVAGKDFYMDDLLTGANSKTEIIEIRDQLIALFNGGGFKIRKWASNSSDILQDIVSQIFDPLGLLGPIIITAKIMIQQLWKTQIGWDESLPLELQEKWSHYTKDLQELGKISIPRKIVVNKSVRREIHGFCDASERAYGACVYMRSVKANGAIEVHLICSKSRVAPIKVLSVPRLELCGAQLLAQLVDKVVSSLEINIDSKHYWTDSQIVIYWLQASNKKLPIFVAHRVGDIQESTSVNNWKHVGSKENPADLLSRGTNAKELVISQLWWGGPSWLHNEILPEEQEETTEYDESQLEEHDRSKVVAVSNLSQINPFDKFSTFNRLIRVAAMCVRFAHNCKGQKQYGPLTVEELQGVIKKLIRQEQEITFEKDIKDLRNKGVVSSQSSLKQLNPFIDEENLLRVGGRLQRSNLQSDVKHPYLLHQRSKLTKLIIEHEHRRLMHAGAEATLASVRLKYWPLKARGTVRKLLRHCIKCFKHRPRFSEQLMGNLPSQRVTPSRPFSCVGIDFCGPIYVREGSRRNSKNIKAYVSIFVCLATKAVHLEVVSNMTTDAFLNAFKRFIARRGRPSDVFSDNGTNFVGANRELEELRNLFNQEEHKHKIIDETSNEQIKWHFIPPRAPHFGGLWEATVKAFKKHFYKIASDVALTFEEASTLVVQIEAILNSRPLSGMSNDPNDFSYISAGHFLIGDVIVSHPEPDITQLKVNRLSRWQHLEQMRQHFWRRWSHEYLSQLQNRTKWQSSRGPALEIGQLVICREDGLPPLKWMLGRIEEVSPGTDGIIRAATIKTSNGSFKRPATKLAVLPIEDELSKEK